MAGPALVWLVLLPCFPASLLLLVITHGAGGIPLLQPQRNPVQFAPEWGSKPEPPKIPSADQRGLSRARSMG